MRTKRIKDEREEMERGSRQGNDKAMAIQEDQDEDIWSTI
jgi:hypothetical protein